MSDTARSTVTLLVLCAMVVLAALWGWSAATEPLPAKVDEPICVPTSVGNGAKVYPQQVTVSVYNASTRGGLAGRTMQSLKDAGFPEGDVGDVKASVTKAVVWTDNPDSPAAQLVAGYLGKKVPIEVHTGLGAGVTVIVGDKFHGVIKGPTSVVSQRDTEICSPPVD